MRRSRSRPTSVSARRPGKGGISTHRMYCRFVSLDELTRLAKSVKAASFRWHYRRHGFQPTDTHHTANTASTVAWRRDHLAPSVSAVRRAEPPYRAVSAALRERIRAGEWLPGEQIPSVRQLAEEYGVSIGTARRATAVLAEQGLVIVTPSWGAFIPE